MSVIKVDVVGWSGSEQIDKVAYEVEFFVTTDDRDDGPFTVRAGLPLAFRDIYDSGNESDSRALLVSSTEQQVSSSDFFHWNVVAKYEETELQTNPLFEPIRETITWNGVESETNLFGDGTPILNTAGDPLADKVKFIDNLPQLSYTLNQATFPMALAQEIRNAVNSSAWKYFDAKMVRVSSMQTDRVYDKRIGYYYQVTYTFEVNPDTWDIAIDSMGFNAMFDRPGHAFVPAQGGRPSVPAVTAGLKKERIIINNVPCEVPMALTSTGELAGFAAPYVITGSIYPLFDFNTLFPFL